MNFPAKLSLLCRQRGWTQRELAEALGDVSKSTVSNGMTGKTDPRRREVALLAQLFQVSVAYLVLDEHSDPQGDGLGEDQRRVLWAAETVGWDVALRRIMNAPSAAPGNPPVETGPRPEPEGRTMTSAAEARRPRTVRPKGRGRRAR